MKGMGKKIDVTFDIVDIMHSGLNPQDHQLRQLAPSSASS